MKNISTILTRIALLAIVGGAFAACTQETSPGTSGPTGVMARAMSSTSIAVRWTRDGSDVSADTVVVTGGAVAISPMVIASPGSSTTVTGLTENTLHTISVRSTSGASNSIQWMTARRTNSIRLWEVTDNSAGHYSALQLNNASNQAAAISFSGANLKNTVDFVLDTTFNDPSNPSGLVFEGADVWSAGYRSDRMFNSSFTVNGGLDNFFTASDLSADTAASVVSTAFSIPSGVQTGSKIVIAKTPDGHVAEIEIVQQTDGTLFGASGGHKFIDVNVSYQPMANQPYAGRPHPIGPHGKALRIYVQ